MGKHNSYRFHYQDNIHLCKKDMSVPIHKSDNEVPQNIRHIASLNAKKCTVGCIDDPESLAAETSVCLARRAPIKHAITISANPTIIRIDCSIIVAVQA